MILSCTGGCNVYTLYRIVDNRYEESITVLVLVSCIFTSSCSGHFFFLGGNQKKSVKGNKKKKSIRWNAGNVRRRGRDSFTMRARSWRVPETSSLPFSRPRRGSDWPQSSLKRETTPPPRGQTGRSRLFWHGRGSRQQNTKMLSPSQQLLQLIAYSTRA